MSELPVLRVRDLTVRFRSDAGPLTAVAGMSFDLRRGETLALVGESGSGKSVSSLAIMRLLGASVPIGGRIEMERRDGRIVDLLRLPEPDMRDVRGRDIAMIFQEPMTSLNPVTTIGAQIVEGITRHLGLGRRAARTRAAELLALVGIPDPARRLDSYPHQLSGGMRQRAMIAMALSCDPTILIADEPTTALDVTIQAQILDLLGRLQQQTGMSMIFITHNLGVVAEIADRVLVMYGGRLVEEAEVHPLFAQPLMPYTIGLLNSVPRLDFSGASKSGLQAIPGSVPDPHAMPPGCGFAPRCAHRRPELCDADTPALEQVAESRQVRCVRWREVAA